MFSDLRHALRVLVQRPRFTAGASLVLGLGLGMVLLLFSTLNALFWRPLPFPDSGQLHTLTWQHQGRTTPSVSAHQLRALAQVAQVGLVTGGGKVFLQEQGRVHAVEKRSVNADYFRVLGFQPLAGRLFGEAEDRGETLEPSLVIPESLWREAFGADPTLIGRSLNTDQGPMRVVGVLRETPKLPFVLKGCALQSHPWQKLDPKRDGWFVHSAILRFRPNQNASAARVALSAVDVKAPGIQYHFPTLRQALSPERREVFLLLLGAAGLLLLLACANVAGLFLARAWARSREEALRAALGGSLGHALRRHLLEALLVSAAGLGLGLGMAILARPLVVDLLPELNAVDASLLQTDGLTLLVGLGLMAGTALLTALLPALQAGRHDLGQALAQEGRSTTQRGRFTTLLIGAQTALVLALLVGSSLLGRSLSKALAVNPGFDANGLLVCHLEKPALLPPSSEGPDQPWHDEVRTLAQGLPGVQQAALTSGSPFGGGLVASFAGPHGDVSFELQQVGPGVLEVLGLPLLEGRHLEAGDRDTNRVVMSRSAARAYFGEGPVVGRTHGHELVGVVGDSHLQGLDRPAPPILYTLQLDPGAAVLLVRTPQNPQTFRTRLVDRMRASGLGVEVMKVERATDLGTGTVRERMRLPLVASAFSLVGLVLAVSGLAASLSALLVQRRRELALRAALGSSPRAMVLRLLAQSLKPVGFGSLGGLLLSLALGRLLQNQLFQVSPLDPAAFLMGLGALLLAALAVTLPPALRAARVQPAEALRSE